MLRKLWNHLRGKERPVFERIEIKLTRHFCPCPGNKAALSWGLPSSAEGVTLQLSCKTCGTVLTIPHSLFLAHFVIEDPNPIDEAEEFKGAPVIRLVTKQEDPDAR